MKINNQHITAKKFAYDGCHKIYLLEELNDEFEAFNLDYEIHNIDELKDIYENSCELRFINNWQLTKTYVPQFEDALIEED